MRTPGSSCFRQVRRVAAGFNDRYPVAAYNPGWNAYNPWELSTNLTGAAKELSLSTNNYTSTGTSTGPTIWSCPNRPSLPALNISGGTWSIGFMYFGGIPTWSSTTAGKNGVASASPVKNSQSKAGWMLCADLVVQLNGTAWSDSTALPYSGTYALPAHKRNGALVPAGGDEVFADGSVRWYQASKMVNLYSANGANQYNFYFWQDDWGGLAGSTPKAGPK